MIVRPLATATLLALAVSRSLPASAQDPATGLDEVLVTATRTEIALRDSLSPAQVIDRDEIERSQATSLQQLLAGRAGIDLANTGGPGKQTSLFLRGAGSNQVLVLVDGVRIGSATAGQPAIQDIPVAQIERIEIVRGPHSSLYGADAIGGVIQIFTRRDRGAPQPRLMLGAGSNGLREAGAGLGLGGERGWFGADLAFLRTDGINACAGTAAGWGAGCFADDPDRDGYRNRSASVRGGARLAEAWTLEGSVLHAAGYNHYDGSWADYSETEQRVYSGRLRYAPSARLALQANAGRSYDDAQDYGPSGHAGGLRTRRDQASLQGDFVLGDGQSLMAGADWLEDRIDGTTAYEVDHRDNTGVFAEYQGRFGAQQLQAGLRHDDNAQFGGHTTGNLGWGWHLGGGLRLSARYATGFRAPSFNDLYYPGFGNPDLAPEESENLNLGLAGEHGDWRWSLDVYENRVDDLISYDAATFLPGNIDRARLRGGELTVAATLGGWDLSAQYSHVDPRNRSDGPYRGHLLPRRARDSGRLDLDRRDGRLAWGATLKAAGPRWDDAANSARVGGHLTFDLRAEYALDADWSLLARVTNLLDQRYQIVDWYNQPGREFGLQLRWRPQAR
ncbi:TonB-dependent receptor domain-containing protein [Pseudoxanthomonas taiwanensis]|uniref:TonB-dependent vitamin B12 receptor n=1 Tax=Pseudoxanthomonas taiwanensis TaxID=176598 RepID=A0A921NUP2_9GAMM|nr:TonB-dependent receptor [Pseudoxanthomonas taiwanensis]KAF1689919.1 TonB-dependent vitamin B12 receptor [Pseudoxanthomonas taiwanensis]